MRSPMAWRSTVSVCTATPSTQSTTTSAPSVTRSAAVTSDEKSTWPGESMRLMRKDFSVISMPFSAASLAASSAAAASALATLDRSASAPVASAASSASSLRSALRSYSKSAGGGRGRGPGTSRAEREGKDDGVRSRLPRGRSSAGRCSGRRRPAVAAHRAARPAWAAEEQDSHMDTPVDLMVMPRSASSARLSVKRAVPAACALMMPAFCTSESVSVDLPWSTCAITLMLRMLDVKSMHARSWSTVKFTCRGAGGGGAGDRRPGGGGGGQGQWSRHRRCGAACGLSSHRWRRAGRWAAREGVLAILAECSGEARQRRMHAKKQQGATTAGADLTAWPLTDSSTALAGPRPRRYAARSTGPGQRSCAAFRVALH
jgi:hypothetical protein